MKKDKLTKILGEEVVGEIKALDKAGLSAVIVQAETAMDTVKKELDANEEYQNLKLKVKDMGSAKREVEKFQKAKIAVALAQLNEVA